jgi:putative ABC transport system permease protein
MLSNAFIFALRNLRKNKLLAFINVLGLTIGISSCLVIFLIANHELSFNRSIPHRDKIYRIYSEFSGTYVGVNRGVPGGMYQWLKDEATGLDGITGFHIFSNPKVSIPGASGEPKKLEGKYVAAIVDPGYFDVFTHYEWLAGNPQQSLTQPFNIVLTESQARLYFGNQDVNDIVGRNLYYNDSLQLTVSGILKDVPHRTDLSFTDFVSVSTAEKSWLKRRVVLEWNTINSSSQLFIRTARGRAEAQLSDLMVRLKAQYDTHVKSDWIYTPVLQPLSELHFNTRVGAMDFSKPVEKSTLTILIAIAGLLLLIAAINFINLETAQASRRAKEVGVRKVLGSSRGRLISHFLVESFILSFVAVLFSLVLSWLAIQNFSDFIPAGLTFDVTEPTVAMFLISCIVGVTLLAGLYPSFVLSSYQPALALKNIATTGSTRSSYIRKGLTVFQFTFSQVLIISTVVIASQISFMLNKDMGFSTEGIMHFSTNWRDKPEKRFVLINELQQMPEIDVISMHHDTPASSSSSSSMFEFDTGKEKLKHNVYRKGGDTAFIKIYNIELLAGRNIAHSDTASEYLINETYLHELGFDDPRDALGKSINNLPIVGVVKDFHDKPLRSKIPPLVIYNEMSSFTDFGIRFSSNISDDVRTEAMKKIETAYKKVYPDYPFTYAYVSDTIKEFYKTETRTRTLAQTATVIAILISCLGLFGLSSFTVIQRTKEIGIRKVLGASVSSIVMLLSRDSLILVAIAFALSAPIAYYIGNSWLDQFAYKMNIGVWIFVSSLVGSVLIAFLTTSLRTVGAAKGDPVKALRYE